MRLSDYIEDSALGRPRYLYITDKLKIRWPFPIVAMLHSSCATVFGRPAFGSKTRWTVPVYRVFSTISNAKYAVKYRLFPTRYHWIKTGLPPGYHDPRSLLLYSGMAVLGRFIDEMGGLDAIGDFNAELRGDPGELEHSQADNPRMTRSNSPMPEGRRRRRVALIAGAVIALGGVLSGVFLWNPDRGPKLLNEPTRSREVRPFSSDPDPRFAPLPFEREGGGRRRNLALVDRYPAC